MPPKGKEAKKKVVEDKTFGLKNKKGAKVGKFVQQVKQQVEVSGNPKVKKELEDKKRELERKKQFEADKKSEIASLFKPVIQQKVPFGVDPKSVLCAFFKADSCQKGSRCKFSHDLDVDRKGTAKIDLYTDARETAIKEKEKDTMDLWDQEKLESVVKSKDDEKNRNNPTDIVCKYFLEALEMQKYGWFWVCPSGDACKYRHALPPGFILKKKETDVEKREREEREKENAITIEDFLETERHKLGSKLTPITYESFSKWKAERKAKATIELELEAKKKADAYKVPGKTGLSFSGRELFAFNPDWAKDGDDDAMEFYERQASDDEAEDVPVIDEDLFDEDLDGLEEEEEQEVEMQVSGIEISE